MEVPTKDALIEKYQAREPKRFFQFDGYGNFAGDCHADSDGHGMFGTVTWELMQGSTVRVLVDPTASKDEVLAMLGKITRWIEDLDGLPSFDPESPLTQALNDAYSVLDTFNPGSGA